jgi:hypothetical protein
MELRFKSGEKPQVKFTAPELKAPKTLVAALTDYGKHMERESAINLATEIESECKSIGLWQE